VLLPVVDRAGRANALRSRFWGKMLRVSAAVADPGAGSDGIDKNQSIMGEAGTVKLARLSTVTTG